MPPRVFLLILVFIFYSLISIKIDARSKIKLSKKYIPYGNPGGVNFHEDEDFAESYRLYEKRRDLLKKKKIQRMIDISKYKEMTANKLQEKKNALLSKKQCGMKVCMIEDNDSIMINKHGINIACLKGAVFMDQVQHESKHIQKKEEEKGKEERTQLIKREVNEVSNIKR